MYVKAIITTVFVLSIMIVSGREPILVKVSDYGLRPNEDMDAVPVLEKIVGEYSAAGNFRIIFEPGRYDFHAKNDLDDRNNPTVAFDFDHVRDVWVEGCGSEFVFHGMVMPFRISNCANITVSGISIDWDIPYIVQGEITGVSTDHLDIMIDPTRHPWEISDGRIWFTGENWRRGMVSEYTNLYDGATGEIVYQTRDRPLGADLYSARVESVGCNTVRFHFTPSIEPLPGNIVAFHLGTYILNGFEVAYSKDVSITDVTIYHTLSCGVHGWCSENITLKRMNIVPNESKGRVFSTVADATHFNGCKGCILLEDCIITGSGDDIANVHGMYAEIIRVENDVTVIVGPIGRYIGFAPGEHAWVVNRNTMQRDSEATVVGQEKLCDENGVTIGYRIRLSDAPKSGLSVGDLLENMERNPDFTIRRCRILKKNRARGILATTAGKVVIEDNYFNTAGAAILIEGDTYLWFESGGVRDVKIRRNVFENCYTSGNNIEDEPWGWGESVISITPSVKPANSYFPPYHRNITIEDNIFRHFDYSVLFARSVGGLRFTGNTLVRTYDYKPFYRKFNLAFDGCRDVVVADNSLSRDFPGRNIVFMNMRLSDIVQSGRELLRITEDPDAFYSGCIK